jgi:Ca-activated chloride channel family protein
MNFAAPHRLLLLLLAAGLVVAYLAAQRRRRAAAAAFASPALLPLVVPQRVGWWRHALAALFAVGLILAMLGAAQPTVPGTAERESATIMLAIDTSDSMKATDVSPSRLEAAADAARDFIGDLPDRFSVGLVLFTAQVRLAVAPTTDHSAVIDALENLQTAPGTALGEAVFTSLAAIPTADAEASGRGQDRTAPAARIVLLSDGKSTSGRPDQVAIEAAVEAQIPVSAIAFGTPNATVESNGQTVDVPVDESALRAIAEGTDGTFFSAANPTELRAVYEQVDADVTVVDTDRDIAVWFAGAALIVVVAAAAVSMLTTARVVWT